MCEPLFALRVSDPPVAYPIRSRPSGSCACPIRTASNLFLFATELHAGHSGTRGACGGWATTPREAAFALRCVALAEHLGSCQVGALAR